MKIIEKTPRHVLITQLKKGDTFKLVQSKDAPLYMLINKENTVFYKQADKFVIINLQDSDIGWIREDQQVIVYNSTINTEPEVS